ncbi:TetR/AcrR family transcriptional regulator [Bacillus sp. ISL-7]|jgi:TetR/AcrR family transcriptional regulator, mexJK operon transcriptional repressor|uniref:TetR/AcrR family transcriptional regulator n=1 Tax=Bacillus sp. ISL-7 TaxID=2819136 RepID=UPI001BEA24BF|nr:TetR/AcrR family transcriptional regulator [Bacillus sp. ISL-7]MBT2736368.1 TetR/AcrR family transcriptional regulator [Bacillus sp. ISL-7]
MPDSDDLLIGEFPFLPKQERAQQKRNALLESGQILFISKGYEQTTAKEIAAHAGVATGTFYRYFSDKRQLLMSLLEDKLDKLLPPEPSWISRDPVTLLASLLEAHNKRLNELGIQRVLPELVMKDPGLAEFLGSARRKIHSRILLGLKQAEEKGLTWEDLDLETVAWAILVLVENGHGKEGQTGKRADFLEISKVICRMVFPPDVLQQLQNTDETNNRKFNQ